MTTRQRRTIRSSEMDSRSFLNTLKNLLAVSTQMQFAEMCEMHDGNMARYLNGNREPKDKVLQDCLMKATVARIFDSPPTEITQLEESAKKLRDRVISRLFGNQIQASMEVESIPPKQRELPDSGGVYVLYDSAGNVLYIGKAKNFRNEVWQTLDRLIPVGIRLGPKLHKVRPTIKDLASYVSLYEIENEQLRHNIEALLIRVFINQTHNSNIGNFKQ